MSALQKLGLAFAIVAGGVEIAFAAAVEAPDHPAAALIEVTAVAGTAVLLGGIAAVSYARQAAIVAASPKPPPTSNRTPLDERLARAERDAAFAAGFAYAEQVAADAERARREVTVTATLEMPVAVTHEMPRVDDGVPDHWKPPVSKAVVEPAGLSAQAETLRGWFGDAFERSAA